MLRALTLGPLLAFCPILCMHLFKKYMYVRHTPVKDPFDYVVEDNSKYSNNSN